MLGMWTGGTYETILSTAGGPGYVAAGNSPAGSDGSG